MKQAAGNPEFPAVDPAQIDEEDLDLEDQDQDDDDAALPAPGEGLVEPAGVPFDEEIERVVQP